MWHFVGMTGKIAYKLLDINCRGGHIDNNLIFFLAHNTKFLLSYDPENHL